MGAALEKETRLTRACGGDPDGRENVPGAPSRDGRTLQGVVPAGWLSVTVVLAPLESSVRSLQPEAPRNQTRVSVALRGRSCVLLENGPPVQLWALEWSK